jgi:hypothetical protein
MRMFNLFTTLENVPDFEKSSYSTEFRYENTMVELKTELDPLIPETVQYLGRFKNIRNKDTQMSVIVAVSAQRAWEISQSESVRRALIGTTGHTFIHHLKIGDFVKCSNMRGVITAIDGNVARVLCTRYTWNEKFGRQAVYECTLDGKYVGNNDHAYFDSWCTQKWEKIPASDYFTEEEMNTVTVTEDPLIHPNQQETISLQKGNKLRTKRRNA